MVGLSSGLKLSWRGGDRGGGGGGAEAWPPEKALSIRAVRSMTAEHVPFTDKKSCWMSWSELFMLMLPRLVETPEIDDLALQLVQTKRTASPLKLAMVEIASFGRPEHISVG